MIAKVLNSKDPNLKKYGLTLVRVSSTDCSNKCNSCKGCGIFLESKNTAKFKDLLVKDPFNISENKIVNIELEDGAILKTSFFLFLLPLILFFVVIGVGLILNINPVIMFSVSLMVWGGFYLYLRNVFKYKTYYFITEVKSDTIQ